MSLQYSSYGAAKEVTGSKHLFTFEGQRILLDCGVFQGKRLEAWEKNLKLPFDAKDINEVILSHGHYDHCGNLPTLVKQGYKGNIYATPASRDIANLIMMDAAHIQQLDAAFLCRKYPEKHFCTPLYEAKHVLAALEQFVTINYRRPFTVAGGVTAEFYEAGHILGSAMTLLTFPKRDGKAGPRVLYTGDVGRPNMPIHRDPDPFPDADYILCEGTYGNRLHDPIDDAMAQLATVVSETFAKGGKVIIPAFAVGRTQELIYFLHLLSDAKRIPVCDIFVDSPMAVNATSIFRVHPECYDEKIHEQFLAHHKNPFGFGKVKYLVDAEESKALNERTEPCIIISSSGMCEGGRILHHLKNNIGDERNTILIVGYMGANTLGRRLADRQPEISIFGQRYPLKARVKILNTFSGHADYEDLLHYLSKVDRKRVKALFLVHGDTDALLAFKPKIESLGFSKVIIPEPGQAFNLP
jgi:metallo-beta-lactamase family protein